jgi:hypothetical protein
MWNLILVRLEIVLLLVQNWCMVYAKGTRGLKSLWMHTMGLLGDEAQVDARLGPFGNNANLDGI